MSAARRLIACCVLLSGCGSGMVRLDEKKVRHLAVVLADRGQAVCPNGPAPEVIAIATYDDGKVFETRTPSNRRGKVRTRDLDWHTEVGAIDEDGVLHLPLDLFPWHDRTFVVRVRLPKRPEIQSELRLTPWFGCGGVADFTGLDGVGGSAGQQGEHAGRGPRVEIALAYVETRLNGRMVLVRVRDRDLGKLEYYLVDPRAGRRFVIDAGGGDGGDGAPGADGTDGKSGTRGADGVSGDMCQNGQDGANGTDGEPGTDGQPGAPGGDGGDGAAVTFVYPAAFPELANVIDVSVEGGDPGAGGRGGKGGKGGEGGPGGSGGSAGPTSDPNRACTTARGNDGRTGATGHEGGEGRSGAAGMPGRPGVIQARTGTVEELFPFELGRGWTFVREGAAEPRSARPTTTNVR
jgi:hypothetical protein